MWIHSVLYRTRRFSSDTFNTSTQSPKRQQPKSWTRLLEMCYRQIDYITYACGHFSPVDAGSIIDCRKTNCVYSQEHRKKGACINCATTCSRWMRPPKKGEDTFSDKPCNNCR
ncbi:hypothetical protein L218DRAFT_611648 [Marasmius fiardii PR-910]|nr:hypothetical protein L218DRAFT_611648 [Marasmius fiardii PR-910]